MYLDQLAYRRDILSPLDGRCRFLQVALLISAAVTTNDARVLAAGIALCLGLLACELRVTLLRLVPVNMMMAAVWLSVPLSSLGLGLDARHALIYTLRVNAAALLYMAFVVPMGIGAIASSMTKLKTPTKLVSLFVLTYRCLFLMRGRLATALVSMRLRSPERGTLYRWRSFAAVFAATMASAVFRSRRVSLAMTTRGFDGAFPVTRKFAWRLHDTVSLMFCALAAALVILG